MITVSAPVSKILDAASEIKNSQQIQKLTGATHASAWFDLSADAFILKEDIGRHNVTSFNFNQTKKKQTKSTKKKRLCY